MKLLPIKSILTFVLLSSCLAAGIAQEKIKIVASASMFADMAKNIATDDYSIESIVPIGSDPHKYKAKPSDARLVQKADIILLNKLTFEGWIDELIDNSGTKAEVVTITEGIKVIQSAQYKNSADPHAWMDASNGVIYAQNIKDALVKRNPEKKEQLEANFESYKAKLIALDKEIMAAVNSINKEQRVLITSHDAFEYYGARYNLRLEAIMGISTEAEAQTSDIIRVTKVIKENNVPAVFIESTINPKMLKQIAKDNKVEIGGELYADSLGDEESSGNTYINMLRSNTNTIVSALNKKRVVSELQESEKSQESISIMDDMPFGVKIAMGLAMILGLVVVLASKMRKS